MSEFAHDNANVSQTIEDNFVIMKVAYDREHKNEEFLGTYPKIEGCPHIFVCESDGTFLHSQGTGELEKGRGYDEEKFMAFLNEWKPN